MKHPPSTTLLLALFLPFGTSCASAGPTPVRSAEETANLKLNYDHPAKDWMLEALPIGNGHMGAMLFGGTDKERIQFNEESLWLGDENDTGQYQNFGELTLNFGGQPTVTTPSNHGTPPEQTVAMSCDGHPKSKWCFEHHGKFPISWQADISKLHGQPVAAYTLTSADDVPERDPMSWRFLGSQDGQTWTVLDERKDQPVWPARGTPKTFTFKNDTAYAHYRFEFLEVHGVAHFQIGEIALGETAAGATSQNYHRELDLNRALNRVTYTRNGVTYTREAFASYPARVIALRITADKPGAVSADLAMADAHGAKPKSDAAGIITAGAIPGHAYGNKTWLPLNYESQVRVINQGGTQSTAPDGSVCVTGADSLIVLLGAGTDFVQDRSKNWRAAPPHEAVSARLDAAAARGWDALLAEHERDYMSLFNRLDLDLGGTASPLPTDRRLATYAKNQGGDVGLEELLFQYGRYLMISSSRPGCLPANLQGKWNHSNSPPWRCDYHTDINVEMNYGLPDPANLPECFEPYGAWISSILPIRTEATRQAFGTRGWAMRGESGPFGGSTWEWTPGTAGWLTEPLYQHYRYTGDQTYLRNCAYPAMKGICEFWLDRLQPLPDGTLVAPRSFSPEQQARVYEQGVSFEQEIIWDVFTNTIEASEILGIDKDFRAELTAKRAKLLWPKIGKWGQLQEWMSDLDRPNDNHRHTSHLVALYPGRQISLSATPELAKAAGISLNARGDESNGWALATRMALWGRLGNGERAHNLLAKYLLRPSTDQHEGYEGGGGVYSNLLCACPPFQIDGNFGYPTAVCDMLVQSQTEEIILLPALPKAWATGHAHGLCVRGGLQLDMEWKNGQVTAFKLKGRNPQPVRVRVNGEAKTLTPEKLE